MKVYSKTLLILAIGTSLVGCSEKKEAPQAPKPTLDVVSASLRDVVGYTSFPASVQGKINNDVRAKIQGYIQEVYVHEGQVVTKGQPLFRLEANNLAEPENAANCCTSTGKCSTG